MMLNINELFIDEFANKTYYNNAGKLKLLSTIGAPAGTVIEMDGITVEDLITTKADFYAGDELNTTQIPSNIHLQVVTFFSPEIVGDGTADFVMQWQWDYPDPAKAGKQLYPVDGFFIQVARSDTDVTAAYDKEGTIVKYVVPTSGVPHTHQYVHNGVMNKYHQFKITPYRTVRATSTTVATVIKGTESESSRVLPSATLTFDNVPVSELNIAFNNVTADGYIEPYEKQYFLEKVFSDLSLTDSSSKHSVLLSKATSANTSGVFNTLLTQFESARAALFDKLNGVYTVANPGNKEPYFYKSKLLGSTSTLQKINSNSPDIPVDNLVDSQRTHQVVSAEFLAVSSAYNNKYAELDLAVDLKALDVDGSNVTTILAVADRTVEGKDRTAIIDKYKSYSTNKSSLVSKATGVVTDTEISTLNSAYTALTAFKTSETGEEGIALSVALINKSKFTFTSAARVTAFITSLETWEVAYDALSTAYDAAIAAFRAELELVATHDNSKSLVEIFLDLEITKTDAGLLHKRFSDYAKEKSALFNKVLGILSSTATDTVYSALTSYCSAQTTTTINLSYAITNSKTFRFTNNNQAKTLLTKINDWEVTYDALSTAYDAALDNLEAANITWDSSNLADLIKVQHALLNYRLIKGERSDLKSVYGKVLTEHSALVTRAENLNYVAGVNLYDNYISGYQGLVTCVEGTTRQTLLNDKVTSLSANQTIRVANRCIVLSSITEALGIFNAYKTALVAKDVLLRTVETIEESVKLGVSNSLADFNLTNSATTTTAITGSITHLPIDFLSGDKGVLRAKVSWTSTIPDNSIDGYLVYWDTRTDSSAPTLPTMETIETYKRLSFTVKASLRSCTHSVPEGHYLNYLVIPYRVLSLAQAGKTATNTLSRFAIIDHNPIIFQEGYSWATAPTKRVIENTVSATAPSTPVVGDWWLDTTVKAVKQYTISGWAEVTDIPALEAHRKTQDKTVWVIQSDTEPKKSGVNTSGYYWKNTNKIAKGVSGVETGHTAFWDEDNGVWDDGVKDYVYVSSSNTATTASAITQYASDGAIYIGTVSGVKHLFKAQNGAWHKVTDFAADEQGITNPLKSSSKLKFLVGHSFYYKRKATSDAWGKPIDLFQPLKITISSKPIKNTNAAGTKI